jgi:hypothetical protein
VTFKMDTHPPNQVLESIRENGKPSLFIYDFFFT